MPAMMFLAASMQVSRRESTAVLPIWGVTTRLFRVSRGSSGADGLRVGDVNTGGGDPAFFERSI